MPSALWWYFYDQAYNMFFHHKLESIQYNAQLAKTGVIRGTSKEMFYQELGLESLQLWHWYRKLGMFNNIYKNKSPQYLFELIPEKTMHILQKMLITLPVLKLDTTSSKTLSFYYHWMKQFRSYPLERKPFYCFQK